MGGPIAPNPLNHDAGDLSLIKAGALQRQIGASLERVWENVADWEHLPHLHNSSFSDITLQDAGSWGWRAALVAGGNPSIVELVWDKAASRYVARTLEGNLQGMEIWTSLCVAGDHQTDIDVEFWVPDMGADINDRVGQALVATYQTLWDEDEAMMQAREQALGTGRADDQPIDLGGLEDVQHRLPLDVDMGGRTVRVLDVGGTLTAISLTCPHMLRPLDDCSVVDGVITCPWHGYRYDVATGRSPDTPLTLTGDYSVKVDAQTGRVVLAK